MTHSTAVPMNPGRQTDSLEQLIQELTDLWNRVKMQDQATVERGRAIFETNPGCRTDRAVAMTVRSELQSLLLRPGQPVDTTVDDTIPAPIPFTLTPVVRSEQAADPLEPDAGPGDAPMDWPVIMAGGPSLKPQPTAEPTCEPEPVEVEPALELPASGFFQALFPMLADQGSVHLTLTRLGNELRVVVMPIPGQGEAEGSVPATVFTHLPSILDRDFATALQPYTRSRLGLQEQALQVQALQGHQPSVKAPPAVGNTSNQTSRLSVKVTPKDAVVAVDGQEGRASKTGVVSFQGLTRSEHTVRVTKTGFSARELPVTLENALHDLAVVLVAEGAGLTVVGAPEDSVITVADVDGGHHQADGTTVLYLPAGMNTLSVTHPDFDVFEKTVLGVVGEVRTVTVSLTPRRPDRLF